MKNNPQKPKQKYSESEISILTKYFELLSQRLINEYEQRDRDFRMYITLNTGLLLIVGALFNGFRETLNVQGWLIFGLLLAIVSVFGIFFSIALRQSVKSFGYWQTNINANLARLEFALLPEPKFGQWFQLLARNEQSYRQLTNEDVELKKAIDELSSQVTYQIDKDLIEVRPALAQLFLGAWSLVGILSLIAIFFGNFLVNIF